MHFRRAALLLLVFTRGFVGMSCKAGAQSTETVMYVSPSGNDSWSGRFISPNRVFTDGPFASIEGARNRLREMREKGILPGPVRIMIRGGMYNLSSPLVFTPRDSGTRTSPVVFEAVFGEHPILFGGRLIKDWKKNGKVLTATLPKLESGHWRPTALWVNGKRRTLARTPNAAHILGDYPVPTDTFQILPSYPESQRGFHFRPGDIRNWESLKTAMVVVYHSWETSHLRIESLNEAESYVTFSGPAAWPFRKWDSHQRYYIENVAEALDQPGEWYFDESESKLHYIPTRGEELGYAEAFVAVAEQLMLFDGEPQNSRFVEYLSFKGIVFSYTQHAVGAGGYSDTQAAYSVPAAIEGKGARHCIFDSCVISHVGTYAIWLKEGCSNNQILRCEMFDLGAGAIRIGETWPPRLEAEATRFNVVENNFLHDGGNVFRAGVGIWVGHASYTRILHNDVSDFRYSGISLGWSWGFSDHQSEQNLIAFNHIHHIGHGQLSDMAGIYTVGVSSGTLIRNNLVHDVVGFPNSSGAMGIYLDEGSSNVNVENNVVYYVSGSAMHQHYGRNNRIQNNIFAFASGPQVSLAREESPISIIFEHNIVVSSNSAALSAGWINQSYFLDRNCYWAQDGKENLTFSGSSFRTWQSLGNDTHSFMEDPRFFDAEKGDFRLKYPNFVSRAIEFSPIDTTVIGLYGARDWVASPARMHRSNPPRAFRLPPNK
jgi:hypothetical protein